MPSVSAQSLTSFLKPRRSEAIARLRSNAIGFITITIISQLTPLPSPWDAFHVVTGGEDASVLWWGACAIEMTLIAIMGFNALQASYALQYPPEPLPAMSTHNTPSKFTPVQSPTSPPPRKRTVLSPTSTPQPQKSFSSSTSMLYASTPASSPSRILNYSTVSGSVSSPNFDTSLNSSFGGSGSLASSPLAAYRGKHSSNSTNSVRAFDGDLLQRLMTAEDDDD